MRLEGACHCDRRGKVEETTYLLRLLRIRIIVDGLLCKLRSTAVFSIYDENAEKLTKKAENARRDTRKIKTIKLKCIPGIL